MARQEGRTSGGAEGKRAALLRLLSRRELALTEDERARILACSDVQTLDRWFDNAFVAASTAEALS